MLYYNSIQFSVLLAPIQPGPRISGVSEYDFRSCTGTLSSNGQLLETRRNVAHDVLMDAPKAAPSPTSLNSSLGSASGNPENIQEEAALFNLDDNEDVTRPNPPQATLENLANMQAILVIEQIQGASWSDEEKQWSDDEFDAFLHPCQ
jgi:hypothetical protein